MANRIDICNQALAEVGEQILTTLDEKTRPAELCRTMLGPAVREVLNRGLWKCARAQAELSRVVPSAGEEPIDWSYVYQLPEDYIRLAAFNEVDLWQRVLLPHLFEVRGDKLLSNVERARVVYVRDLSAKGEEVHLMPPLLTRAVVLALAAKLSWPLTASRPIRQALEEACEIAIRHAKSAGAVEEHRPVLDQEAGSRWIRR